MTAGANPQTHQAYVSNARWAKPLAKPRVNMIPSANGYGYRFIDKDPELEFVLFAIAESGMTLEQIERETEKNGTKVSRYTLMAWSFGSTKRPQNHTMNSVMLAIGWVRPWIRRA